MPMRKEPICNECGNECRKGVCVNESCGAWKRAHGVPIVEATIPEDPKASALMDARFGNLGRDLEGLRALCADLNTKMNALQANVEAERADLLARIEALEKKNAPPSPAGEDAHDLGRAGP